MEKHLDLVKQTTDKLIEMLGVDASANVEFVSDNIFNVDITTPEETGLLIGFRGENIFSLQTVLGVMLKSLTGEWLRINVNVGDYKQKQEQKLKDMADQIAVRAVESGQDQPIYNLNATQRRIIHLHLSDRDDVFTESQGEEENRYLVVKPK